MNKQRLRLSALLLAALAASNAAGFEWSRRVRVESGLVEGVPSPDQAVVAFKGIPYAAAPVGNLRWREPQPAARWEGIRGAANFGACCTQPPGPGGKGPAEMGEDCLFINVWTPARSADEKLAVLFFIHGGMGVFGSGNLNGAELARKGIVVVTMNYRLGLLAGMGHPGLSAESPHRTSGSYGMLDLIAALRWVQTNIAAFGGDPAKVTIAGHSSGASAMHHLTTSPVAKGLFRGAIGVSFAYDYLTKPHTIPFVRQKEENGLVFAKLKNCASLEDLRMIPAADLIADDPAVANAKLHHLGSAVARDGRVFPATYADALDQGLASDVPTLTGFTADDFGPPARCLKTTVDTFAGSLPGMFGEHREAFATRRTRFSPYARSPPTRRRAKPRSGRRSNTAWPRRFIGRNAARKAAPPRCTRTSLTRLFRPNAAPTTAPTSPIGSTIPAPRAARGATRTAALPTRFPRTGQTS